MSARRNIDGIISNASELVVDDVVGDRVLCPSCHDKVFQVWPEGWDAHAAHRCTGVGGNSEEERKANFKHRWSQLFR
jgi:hypothetical protein